MPADLSNGQFHFDAGVFDRVHRERWRNSAGSRRRLQGDQRRFTSRQRLQNRLLFFGGFRSALMEVERSAVVALQRWGLHAPRDVLALRKSIRTADRAPHDHYPARSIRRPRKRGRKRNEKRRRKCRLAAVGERFSTSHSRRRMADNDPRHGARRVGGARLRLTGAAVSESRPPSRISNQVRPSSFGNLRRHGRWVNDDGERVDPQRYCVWNRFCHRLPERARQRVLACGLFSKGQVDVGSKRSSLMGAPRTPRFLARRRFAQTPVSPIQAAEPRDDRRAQSLA